MTNVLDPGMKPRPCTVVVGHNLDEIREPAHLTVILIGTVERTEGNVVVDVPPHLDAGLTRLGDSINVAVHLSLALRPECLPGEQLRILQQEPPETHERTIGRAVPLCNRVVPFYRPTVACLRPAHIDATLAGHGSAVGAEAGDELRPGWRLHQQVKGARAFGSPGDAVEVVTLDVIFDDAQMPVAIVGIVETRALCGSSPGIDFQALGKVWVIA